MIRASSTYDGSIRKTQSIFHANVPPRIQTKILTRFFLAVLFNWEVFKLEALRIWDVYSEVAEPTEEGQLSLRYLNRIPISNDHLDLADYIDNPPDAPNGFDMDIFTFLHKDTFIDSSRKYAIDITKTAEINLFMLYSPLVFDCPELVRRLS